MYAIAANVAFVMLEKDGSEVMLQTFAGFEEDAAALGAREAATDPHSSSRSARSRSTAPGRWATGLKSPTPVIASTNRSTLRRFAPKSR